MNIAMFPYDSSSNKYIYLIKDSLKINNIKTYDFNEVKKDNVKFDEIEYFILNWYESLYTNSIFEQTKIFLKKYINLMKLKINKKKIIWVVHNRVPHNDKYKFYSKTLMKWLAQNSYKIVIHSHESKTVIKELVDYSCVDDKIVYVPHPNYIGAYKTNECKEYISNKLNLLFIGAIQPYKNVDLLIEAFNELDLKNATLTLAGKVSNKQYENYINKLINNNSNIITDFRFIEDDEITDLIRMSNVLVLPYDINSSLNSGSIILAFSNSRTVLSPLIGTLKDFENKNLFFSYEYEDHNMHKKALKENIISIYNKFEADNNILNDMGKACFDKVKEENSLEVIANTFKEKIFYN